MEINPNGVPHIPYVIDDNDINGGAIKIIEAIRPQWKTTDIEFKMLTDGITNKLVGCKPKDIDDTETVLVRVYGNKTDLLIDRKAETSNILRLSRIGLAPNLYATFDNGLAYQFVPGCTLTDDTVVLSEIYNLVAKRMAKLHKVTVEGEDNSTPCMWEKLWKFYNLVPDVFTNNCTDRRYRQIIVAKENIENEINSLMSILTELDSPVVFAHNDLLLGNVIYTKEKNCVTFIDFEYAAVNYQAFDIGNHFAEFVGVDVDVDYTRKYPNKKFQLNWLRTYLSEYQGKFSERDVHRLYVQVNKFVLVSHLFWGLWALIQAEHSHIEFDYLGYAATRFNEYFARKSEFLSLEVPEM